MTFEEEYGRWLVGEINKRTKAMFGLICRQYNELSFKPLAKNPDEIAIVINGGGASRSNVRGQDQNSGTFSVIAICQKKHMEKIKSAIEYVQRSYNAVPSLMSYKEGFDESDIVYLNVKSVFFTPIVLDAQDYPTEEYGTLKTVFMQFSVNILYGKTAVVEPELYVFEIDGVEYTAHHVASYDNASIPTYDSYMSQGEDRSKQVAVAKNNSWAFTLYKTSEENALQTILENELYGRENGLWGRSVVLKKDMYYNAETQAVDYAVKIPIQTFQLTESYVNNAAAYVLTLMA